MKNNLEKLDFSKYKLFILDWDGTLIDSKAKYQQLDKLFVEDFYKISDTSALEQLEYKCVSDDWRDLYYKKIDNIYADGATPLDKIYRSVNKFKIIVQTDIEYIKSAAVAVNKVRKFTDIKLAIATNSNTDDMDFFSSKEWPSSYFLNPKETFDKIVTMDDVKNVKPHVEIFKSIIDYYNLSPSEVLVFDDDPQALASVKKLGADTLQFVDRRVSHVDDIIENYVDFYLDDWNVFIKKLVESSVYQHAQDDRIDKPTVHDHFIWKDEWQDADYYELKDGTAPGIQWTGIYCFGNLEGKIPIVNYEHYPSGVPGGHIDSTDRNLTEALIREIKEELNCTVINWEPVGYKIILKPDKTVDYQLFVYADLKKDGEFIEDVGGLVNNYTLHDISEFGTKIEWNETSKWLEKNLAKRYK